MTARTRMRRGQALTELAVGLLALVIVVLSLVVFAHYIVRSLEIENSLRGRPKGVADKIELEKVDVSGFASEKIFGTKVLHIKEPMPNPRPSRTIP